MKFHSYEMKVVGGLWAGNVQLASKHSRLALFPPIRTCFNDLKDIHRPTIFTSNSRLSGNVKLPAVYSFSHLVVEQGRLFPIEAPPSFPLVRFTFRSVEPKGQP